MKTAYKVKSAESASAAKSTSSFAGDDGAASTTAITDNDGLLLCACIVITVLCVNGLNAFTGNASYAACVCTDTVQAAKAVSEVKSDELASSVASKSSDTSASTVAGTTAITSDDGISVFALSPDVHVAVDR